ncbi:magnesium transporter MgtE N-terminal domain-containing protein, partial [Mobilicoccus pelagius]
MSPYDVSRAGTTPAVLERAAARKDLAAVAAVVAPLSVHETIDALERMGSRKRALVYRLLPKDKALAVFEGLDAPLQSELVRGL